MAYLFKKWRGLSALLTAPALVFLDQTILPVALPVIQRDFSASSTALQWCINGYLLAIAVLVLVSGKLSDRLGHRKALCCGVVGFALCSILCGLSTNIGMLIGARILQGCSAAFIFPAQTTLISKVFPEGQRGKAIGTLVSVGSLFLILGPFIGGYLTDVASWRWIFWINLPISATGLFLILRFIPRSEKGHRKIDVPGFIFFALGTASLGTFLMQVVDWGWTGPKTLLMIGATLFMFLLLLLREKKIEHPFLDLALFKRPVYAAININIAMTQFILMISVFQTIYFEKVLGYSPLQTGLIYSLGGIPTLFMAPVAGWLSDRYTPKIPISLGYCLLIFSFFLFAFINLPSLPILLISLTSFGIGIPFILTPSFSSAMSSVPPQKTGLAMGMVVTLRMLGGMIGLALIHLLTSVVQQRKLPIVGQRNAEIASFAWIQFALGFLIILAFAITFVLHNRKSSHHLPDAPSEGWD
jgi:EmrB/QacA subfamily drug resistance transporter